MSDIEVAVSGIEYKVRKLAGLLQRSEAENRQLMKELADLQSALQEQRQQVRQLEEKVTKLHMAKALVTKQEVAGVKQKINQMVREIDRCLALLNK
jgi:predicted nuclease with TOPRIM domain